MADNPKAAFHRRALASPGLSDEARAHHQEQLRKHSGDVTDLPGGPNHALAARADPENRRATVPIRPKSSAPKPPRAAKKAAASSPPADAQRAAPSPPAPSAAAAYTAAHAHLHQGPAPAAKKAAPTPQPQVQHTPQQMTALAGWHEQQHRRLIAEGDARSAAVHEQKAAALRKTLETHPGAASVDEGRSNPEVSMHMERASHSRMLANRAGVARAAAAADVLTAKRKAEEVAADPNRGKGSVEHGMALAEVAAQRAQVAHHANIEKTHFAEEKVHIAHAKTARAETAEESARAENEAQAAHARADQAHEAVRGGEQRIAIAKIHAHAAANPQEQEARTGHAHRDPVRERREHIARAAKNFAELFHTGSDELIKHMQREVGH